MSQMNLKIKEQHLARKAVVYLRQSSLRQVRENLESQRLQYALADRARQLGWQNVETIDTDLGVSAGVGSARAGFERLVTSIALREVGIVFAREASRLSRNDKDWHHLLEVCQAFDTLIGDEEQVYDLSLTDDQLILGIKGTMSVVELSILKLRMLQGKEAKAQRGEYITRLPPGYVLDATGQVVMDPNERIREAIYSVFRKYRELWSVRKTCQWFRDHEVKLPVNQCLGGRVDLSWRLPKMSFVRDILTNPFYAGVYVYGRGKSEIILKDGKLVRRRTRPARHPEDCRVFLPNHHPGYITWEMYEENRKRMLRSKIGPEPAVAAVRAGQGLLAGLLRCGRCGRKLHVRYWGRSGTAARYFCKGDYHEGGRYCLAFGGSKVDRRIGEEVLRVISPLGVEASLRILERKRAEHNDEYRNRALELEELDFEVERAFDQYNQADPRNRLVAAELERRWNVKLAEREKLRADLASLEAELQPLSVEDERRIRALGEDFEQVWKDECCPIELKKKIVHTAVEEIVADLEGENTIRLIIHWKGGIHSQVEMPKPSSAAGIKTSSEALEIIRKLAHRYGDADIAAVLNKLGLQTGKGLRWTEMRVATARRSQKIVGQRRTIPNPELLSQKQAAQYAGVSDYMIRRMVEEGFLTNEQEVPMAPWEIRRSEFDSEPVRWALRRYRRTGRLPQGGSNPDQMDLSS